MVSQCFCEGYLWTFTEDLRCYLTDVTDSNHNSYVLISPYTLFNVIHEAVVAPHRARLVLILVIPSFMIFKQAILCHSLHLECSYFAEVINISV